MTEGFVPDFIPGSFREERWVEGVATWNWLGQLKTTGKKQFKLTVYRCDGCGFLETFADKRVF